jgi:transcriptional regulator with XRE-family HTH domain
MKKKLDSYLLSYRRRSGFSQRELSYLLGYQCPSVLSRLEKGKRAPFLLVALAWEILFDVPAAELFPGLFARIEEEVLTRAFELYQRLEGNPSRTAQAKRAVLAAAFERRTEREKSKTA